MPYTSEHKRTSREKILKSAWKLFSRRGFDNVSIDELMNAAGMTRGAFYAHFKTKSDVYQESILAILTNGRLSTPKPDALSDRQWLKLMLSGYLSRGHIDDEPSPCPLAFLATDVANREPRVRQAYTQVYRSLINLIRKHCDQDRELIMAITAMMIGSVAIARALDDSGTGDRLLISSRKVAERLIDGG